MIRQLPLFPLGTLLYPGATMTLHIFEERYRAMISRCLESGSPFGVVLIREGDEVTEGRVGARPAEPHSVGTVAQISANVKLDDGRYLLTAVGETRFRIQYIVQHTPYLIASVVELADQPDPAAAPLAAELRALYARYWQAVAIFTGVPAEADDLPADPTQLSYQLADRLQVPFARKQHWLEADLRTRLREIIGDLRAELALLPGGRDGRRGEGGASLN